MITQALTLRSDLPLPTRVEDITPNWLRQALDCDIVAIETDTVIWGTATKALVNLEFGDGSRTGVCVKGGFNNPELLAQMGPSYQAEARFYGELGTRLERGIPRCHFAGIDTESGQGIVILDDLRDSNATFGDPRKPIAPDAVAEALAGQVAWHTARETLPDWLPSTPLWRQVLEGILTPEHWTRQITTGKAAHLPPPLRDRDRVLAGLRASWRRDDHEPVCVVHGDANLTNLVLTQAARPWFLDWQLVCASHWAHDVALFLISALDVADRRAHERALIAGYAAARREHGDDLDDDTAFDAYRRHALHGLMYAFIPDDMQPPHICQPFIERFTAAVLDHQTLELLEQ